MSNGFMIFLNVILALFAFPFFDLGIKRVGYYRHLSPLKQFNTALCLILPIIIYNALVCNLIALVFNLIELIG